MNKDYERWTHDSPLTSDELKELKAIEGNEKEIAERFTGFLEFGTAGLRGVMEMGTARLNVYTVRHVSQAFANYLNKKYINPSIAIGYDSRHHSEEYSKEAASVFAINGVKVFIYDTLMPTPALSFAIRHTHANAGVILTASHNPGKYNGYKAYDENGCQVTPEIAKEISDEREKLDIFNDVSFGDFDSLVKQKKIILLKKAMKKEYISSCLGQSLISKKKEKRVLNLVYSPLNGAGMIPVMTALKKDGFKPVVVEEQSYPDGDYPTCPYPNPEMAEALSLGINNYLKGTDRDIFIATDPDSDRVGTVVNHHGEMRILTGNEIGMLLFNFIFDVRKENGTLPEKPVVVKSFVSSDMVKIIADSHNAELVEVLTGFRYIGEVIHKLELNNELNRFIFGFEESCGYLTNPDIRDKDAVNASLLIAEMANHYKLQGKTLVDVLDDIYKTYGDYRTKSISFEFEGLEGKAKIGKLMDFFKDMKNKNLFGEVEKIGDYSLCKFIFSDHETDTGLPKANAIKFFLTSGETVTIRPSGTEPKIKAYVFAKGETRLEELLSQINQLITKF